MIVINYTQNCGYFHPLKILGYSERFNLDSVYHNLFPMDLLNYSLPHRLELLSLYLDYLNMWFDCQVVVGSFFLTKYYVLIIVRLVEKEDIIV